MTVERHLLRRWRRPRRSVLTNEEFPSGRPPFAPFPTVTNLVNANLCPLAAYHDLIHGIQDALEVRWPGSIREERFLRFISSLKLSIRRGDIEPKGDMASQIRSIQNEHMQFSQAHGISLNESSDIWRLHVEPWVTRKLQKEELQVISSDDRFFFEVAVADSRVSFPLDGGVRNYPLRGVIDEIDLSNRRIIKRTIREGSVDENPPLLKDYQVWLPWKILCGLGNDQLPSSWRNVDFENFNLVIETPQHDFEVSDDEDRTIHTHRAYAWIDDISISEPYGVVREVRENAQCAWENPHPECEHPVDCYPRRYPFPQSRPQMRRAFQPWYRFLLWEQMWKGHLWYYQLLMLKREELIDLGLIVETSVISVRDNEMELELSGRKANTLRGYDHCSIIPFGTVFCGIKLDAQMMRTDGNRVFLRLNYALPDISDAAFLLLSPDLPAPVMKEPLTFLDRQTQSALFGLNYHMGALILERAQNRSLIQLLEAVFGTRPLRRGGN